MLNSKRKTSDLNYILYTQQTKNPSHQIQNITHQNPHPQPRILRKTRTAPKPSMTFTKSLLKMRKVRSALNNSQRARGRDIFAALVHGQYVRDSGGARTRSHPPLESVTRRGNALSKYGLKLWMACGGFVPWSECASRAVSVGI